MPSSWLPACTNRPTSNTTKSTCGSRSDLADDSNKQWGGLVGSFYAGRYRCYIEQAAKNLGAGAALDYGAYNKCLDDWAWEWQHDFGGTKHKICWTPAGNAATISRELLAKYTNSSVR